MKHTKRNQVVKVRTLATKHIEQLKWIHDEDYNFNGKKILGRYNGALIVQHKNGKLDRVSVTVFVHQQIPKVGYRKAYDEGNHNIPQLFHESTTP